MTSPQHSPTPPSRKPVVILAALFFVPLILSFALYYGLDGWRPSGSTNHGDLIDPARPLPMTELLTPQDQTTSEDFLRGKWTLAYIGDGGCDVRCRDALTLTRQTRLALNDDIERVQRVFFVTANCCDNTYLEAVHPGLITARLDEASDRAILDLFPRYAEVPVERAGRIYIIDPLGNLMMSYAPDAPRKGLLEDLKRLLKLSHIG